MPSSASSLKRRSTAGLLRDWAAIMRELRRRGAIRSENNPAGDLAEALVADLYEVEQEANSTAGYDLCLTDGTRIQVKSRRRTPRSKPSHYGLIRKLDKDPFDDLVAVNLNEEFAVESAFGCHWRGPRVGQLQPAYQCLAAANHPGQPRHSSRRGNDHGGSTEVLLVMFGYECWP